MQEYWDCISPEHQEKLKTIAENRGVDLDTAMRNIVNYLKSDNNSSPYVPDYFRDVVLAKDIEDMIDMIAGKGGRDENSQ